MYKIESPELNLQFQLSQARILDARRRFLDASQAYHNFSFSPILEEGERHRALSSAIVCAVLAPAGPQRSRTLAKLYKDERAPQMEEYGILEKMFLDRLLSPGEVTKFADKLLPHQLAQTSDGSTVLAKAVIEHNLLSASRLYENIETGDLGALLGLDAEKAEEYAARMLEQGRLTGRIDQIDNMIFFDGREGSGERINAVQINGAVRRGLRNWDYKVQGIAEEVERVASMLQSHYPVRMSTENHLHADTWTGPCRKDFSLIDLQEVKLGSENKTDQAIMIYIRVENQLGHVSCRSFKHIETHFISQYHVSLRHKKPCAQEHMSCARKQVSPLRKEDRLIGSGYLENRTPCM